MFDLNGQICNSLAHFRWHSNKTQKFVYVSTLFLDHHRYFSSSLNYQPGLMRRNRERGPPIGVSKLFQMRSDAQWEIGLKTNINWSAY